MITHQRSGRLGGESSTPVLHAAATMAVLIVIALGGAALRLVGMDWDEGQHLHPDERFLSMVTGAISPVDSWAQYFDTQRSPLNPNNVGYGFFVYGNFPITLVRYVTEWTDSADYYSNYLVGRSLSAAADILVIVLVFLIGRQLFDRRIGLLGALLYAAAALPIQLSHFFTVDTFTNLFVAAAFWFAARALTAHHWPDYILFGIALGLAMASKVSVFPFALILIAALGLRVWLSQPVNDAQPAGSRPQVAGQWWLTPPVRQAVLGLILAGAITVLVFRIGQPYAFLPSHSDVAIEPDALGPVMTAVSRLGDPVGLRPNPAWLEQMAEVRRQVSGYSDIPPNHQWGRRLPLIFPWVNMVRVGMGWPLGLWCWLALAWAVWEIARGHRLAERLILPVLWILTFFIWQGIGWVKTMRYFLPVYPFLTLLGGWALVTLWDRVASLLASRPAVRTRWPLAVVGGLATVIVVGAAGWGFAVSRIYTRPVTRVAASDWMLTNIASDLTLTLDTPNGQQTVQVGLRNSWLPPSQVDNDPTRPPAYYTYLAGGLPQPYEIRVPVDGVLSGLRLTHVIDPASETRLRTLRVALSSTSDFSGALAEDTISATFAAEEDPRGQSYQLDLPPVSLEAGKLYYLVFQPDASGPLVISGSAVATEGAWDDPLPVPTPPFIIWDAQYHGYELEMSWEDTADKRERMKYILDRADYLVISSNRFYASLSRNPERFPLSIAYYQALFSGELGFRLVGDFTSRPNLGPISFFDDTAEEAWTVYDHPRVLIFRKTAAYDAARVAAILDAVDVDSAVRAIARDARGRPVRVLPPRQTGSTDLDLLTSAGAAPAADPPPGLYRAVQPLAVLIWYVVITGLGWIGFVLWFSLIPGLPDRGYGLGRIFGWLSVTWLTWMLASLRAVPWSTGGAWMSVLALAGLAAVLGWPRRTELVAWLRQQRRHVLLVEGLFLSLFLIFLLIRWGNPDLWHPAYGGEKPMDLSYFNAVLRSASFPPFDPWFAGGFINYYYFGFVIAALPVRLLGMPSTLAYNLILPTLFAVAGTAAFSAAYNLLAPHRETASPPAAQPPTLWSILRAWPRVSATEVLEAMTGVFAMPSENRMIWQARLAGIAAMLLAVGLGNLDQIRTLLWGLAELGAGEPAYATRLLPAARDLWRGLTLTVTQNQLPPVGLGEWYWNATRVIPVPLNAQGVPLEVGPITEFPFFTFLYADLHAHLLALPITLLALSWGISQARAAAQAQAALRLPRVGGFVNMLVGALVIGALRPTNTWDWLTYLALGSALLMIAHAVRRSDHPALIGAGTGAALAIAAASGALSIGSAALSDASTGAAGSEIFLAAVAALIGFGIGFAAGLLLARGRAQSLPGEPSAPPLVRSWVTLLGAITQIALLAGLTMLLYLPFILNYRLGYSTVIPWTGSTTPLWAYLDILGLFLFVICSWMAVESANWWMARAQSASPRQRVLAALLLLALVAVFSSLAASRYPVAAVALPLILWSLALFIRRDQTVEKRVVLTMLIVALALTLIVEVFVLQGDISRMNTVFKFYLQVWVLLAVTAGAALGWLWPAVQQARRRIRLPWLTAAGMLVFLAALYPIMATRAKVQDRWAPAAPKTLDGMAYMLFAERYENGVTFSLAPDYHMLRWLQEHITGAPITLEAQTVEYQWGSRVAVYTGLPTVLGWNWHQRQQRPPQSEEIWERAADIQEAYNTTDIAYARQILDRYQVELIIVGDLERAYYNAEGLGKFAHMAQEGSLILLYDREGTQVYRVVRGEVSSW